MTVFHQIFCYDRRRKESVLQGISCYISIIFHTNFIVLSKFIISSIHEKIASGKPLAEIMVIEKIITDGSS